MKATSHHTVAILPRHPPRTPLLPPRHHSPAWAMGMLSMRATCSLKGCLAASTGQTPMVRDRPCRCGQERREVRREGRRERRKEKRRGEMRVEEMEGTLVTRLRVG